MSKHPIRRIQFYQEKFRYMMRVGLIIICLTPFYSLWIGIHSFIRSRTKLIADLTEICIPSKIIRNKFKNKPGMTGQVLNLFRQAKS